MTVTFYFENSETELNRIPDCAFTMESCATPRQAHEVCLNTKHGYVTGVCNEIVYTYHHRNGCTSDECVVLVSLVNTKIKKWGENDYEKYSKTNGYHI